MPQYVIPQQVAANAYDRQAHVAFATGESAGLTSDKYVRDTVFLATVLFLVGISSHLRIRQTRYALVAVGVILLGFSIVQLLGLRHRPEYRTARRQHRQALAHSACGASMRSASALSSRK